VLLREREQLASDGFVVVVTHLDAQNRLSSPLQIVTRGFVFQPQAGDLLVEIEEQVSKLLAECVSAHDTERVLRQELQEFIHQETKRRPMVIPVLIRPETA
jgi:ribonuclease J